MEGYVFPYPPEGSWTPPGRGRQVAQGMSFYIHFETLVKITDQENIFTYIFYKARVYIFFQFYGTNRSFPILLSG